MIKIKFLATTFFIKCILQPLFQSAQHFYETREGSGSVLVTNGSECGYVRPKNIRIIHWYSCMNCPDPQPETSCVQISLEQHGSNGQFKTTFRADVNLFITRVAHEFSLLKFFTCWYCTCKNASAGGRRQKCRINS
jgi:hypothetical protein